MNLILVESPTKARTLARFLGKDYRIEATFGHLRDLPKGELGVDTDHDFLPKYVIPRDKARRVKDLRSLAADKTTIILATDPDREGEAIAFHVAELLKSKSKILNPKSKTNSKSKSQTKSKIQKPNLSFSRITFHEITDSAIKEALAHPGEINLQLVDAQQARRVLDRLVGYKLSPLLWKKLSRNWLSAGRVQSVAVRLIVEREREIEKFKKEEYWAIEGEFSQNQKLKIKNQNDKLNIKNINEISGPSFAKASTFAIASVDRSAGRQARNDNKILAKLTSKDGVKYEISETLKLFDGSYTYTKTSVPDEEAAKKIITDLKEPFTVSAVDKKETKRYPAPPYTTSTLQIDAGRRLGYSAKRIMQLAQNLYEDGLITYHRTDSVNLAAKFLGEARNFIEKTYGREYSHFRTYTTKSKLAQEAHEAIRPTSLDESQKSKVKSQNGYGNEHFKLYELIWKRAVASQMTEAVFDSTTIDITSINNYLFETQGSVVKFDGFLKVAGYDKDTVVLPTLQVGESLDLVETLPTQKFTQPPPRYSEASLIKALEEDGIGRPSTYAPTIATIQERQYVAKEVREDGRLGRNFVPTELGFLVNDFLVKYFPNIVDLPFTATLEDELDEIAQGKREWVPVIREFYAPFSEKLDYVEGTVAKQVLPVEKTGETCPECKKGEVVIKQGKYGKFYACSRFPECKFTKNLVEKLDIKCPQCKIGDAVVRKTKTGRTFYGCSRYPECKFASWQKPTQINNS